MDKLYKIISVFVVTAVMIVLAYVGIIAIGIVVALGFIGLLLFSLYVRVYLPLKMKVMGKPKFTQVDPKAHTTSNPQSQAYHYSQKSEEVVDAEIVE
jgi:23S rRNA maturation mini-RNase III